MLLFFILFHEGLTIVWQSPTTVRVRDMKAGVCLYCICSLHSFAKYTWRKFGDVQRQFQSTAVLYVKCTVASKGEEIESDLIEVIFEPGTILYEFTCTLSGMCRLC